MQIIKCKTIRSEQNKNYVWVIIAVNNVSELITHKGKYTYFVQCSIAWDINSNKIYGLNGNSEWIEQTNVTISL